MQSAPTRQPRADLASGVVHVGAPLALGIALYTLFGTHAACVATLPGATRVLAWVRDIARMTLPLPPRWLVHNLPDALWGYAVGAFVAAVWGRETTFARWLWTGIAFALVAGFELGQRARLVPGTFDVIDLASSCGAFVAAVALSRVLRGDSATAPSNAVARDQGRPPGGKTPAFTNDWGEQK